MPDEADGEIRQRRHEDDEAESVRDGDEPAEAEQAERRQYQQEQDGEREDEEAPLQPRAAQVVRHPRIAAGGFFVDPVGGLPGNADGAFHGRGIVACAVARGKFGHCQRTFLEQFAKFCG